MLALTKQLTFLLLLTVLLCVFNKAEAQEDTSIAQIDTANLRPLDSVAATAPMVRNVDLIDSILKFHSPRKAAIRSALLPGLGQIYNRKYWKLPIIYGGLGVTGAVFSYNLRNYRDLRLAYRAKVAAQPRFDPVTNQPIPGDSSEYALIRPDLVNLQVNSLRSFRDEFRRNIDYTVLVFILLWGLNVVDATVDAHLKSFDVSPELSFRMDFGKSQMAGTTGVSFILALK